MAGQLAVVTGASSGIGYNLAKVFAENGFDLVIGAGGDRLAKAEADFRAMGVAVQAVQADLATYEGVEEFWRQVEGTGRAVEAAAINAGVGVGGLFAETALDEEMRLVRTNVEGTVHLAKHVVKHMVGRGSGEDPDHGVDRERDGGAAGGGVCRRRRRRPVVCDEPTGGAGGDGGVGDGVAAGAGGHGLLSSGGDGRHAGGAGGQEGIGAV